MQNPLRLQDLLRHLHGVDKARPLGQPPEWLHDGNPTSTVPVPVPMMPKALVDVVTPQEYWEQRKRLPDSELVEKIWQLPHWCIWSRPEIFRKAQSRNLDHCAQFVSSANVRSHARWSQYPWFSTTTEEGDESIAHGMEITEGITHYERWVLFQSGQFVHNMALDQILQLGNRTHVLEILDTVTAVFEFVGRMVDRGIITDRLSISFELRKVAGRQLTWPQDVLGMSNRVDDDAWCQEKSIAIENICRCERNGREPPQPRR